MFLPPGSSLLLYGLPRAWRLRCVAEKAVGCCSDMALLPPPPPERGLWRVGVVFEDEGDMDEGEGMLRLKNGVVFIC